MGTMKRAATILLATSVLAGALAGLHPKRQEVAQLAEVRWLHVRSAEKLQPAALPINDGLASWGGRIGVSVQKR